MVCCSEAAFSTFKSTMETETGVSSTSTGGDATADGTIEKRKNSLV